MDGLNPLAPVTAGLGILLILLYLAILGFYIYCVVLFVKLARRGIKVFDIYLGKNSRPFYSNPQNFSSGPPQGMNNIYPPPGPESYKKNE